MKSSIALLTSLVLASAAHAETVSVEVRGPDGRPLEGAVVWVSIAGASAPSPVGRYTVAQQNISFEPHVLIVPVGASVEFPNRDRVRHHVYSFSKAKKFDLKLYGREEHRAVTFDAPGVVSLGCNIHDRMSGYVFVTASRFTAQANGVGRVIFAGVPQGRATLNVWHPSIRAAGNTLSQQASVGSAGLSTMLAVKR